MARLTIALAQTTARLGDPEANLEKHLTWIEDARTQGADLVVFPELSLTGYVLQDLTSSVARRATPDEPLFGRLLAASRKIDRLGFVEADPVTDSTSRQPTCRRLRSSFTAS
jgi:predicted amidohydrolase